MHRNTIDAKKGGGSRPTITATDRGDGVNVNRQSSLLPGEVRTPSMIVTLSEAWGDNSADWAAPGSSSVWEEEAPSRHSAPTPLRNYGHSDVWASAAGSPLMGDDIAHQPSFGQAGAKNDSDSLDTAELAAAALQALSPQGALHEDSHDVHGSLPQRQALQPRYSTSFNYGYDSRFGSMHITPPMNNLTQYFPSPQLQQPPPGSNYFMVREGSVAPNAMFGESTPMSRGGAHPATLGSDAVLSSPVGLSYVPRLEDKEVAHRIIASAGLPLSINSLVDYIHGGQPHAPAHAAALGTTQNALRNYPNLSEPPTEEEKFGGRGVASGSYGGRPQRGRHGQPSQGHGGPTTSSSAQGSGFAVSGQDTSSGSRQDQPLTPPFNYSSGFMVSAGISPTTPSRTSARAPYGPHGNGVSGRYKSESKYLSDLLHFHANFFPPPPPPRVPNEERRSRAELWYHYASKWDITHRLPPPPRTPLPEMELEYRMHLQQMTRVPYHGDGWLQLSERWFNVMQELFDFPEENVGEEVDFSIVLQQAVLS
ncbi:hypothetical protein MNV84_06355 [Leishmania braziliensis]|nr:hypothetical protein MNV84_06355 [Leishmania braziliensis]